MNLAAATIQVGAGAGVVASPTPRAGRAVRAVAWLGAVVLLVLVATAGLPTGSRGVVVPAAIEAVEVAVVRADAGVMPAVVGVRRPGVGAVAVPRPQSRTRSVQDRGLPPPRAPTC